MGKVSMVILGVGKGKAGLAGRVTQPAATNGARRQALRSSLCLLSLGRLDFL